MGTPVGEKVFRCAKHVFAKRILRTISRDPGFCKLPLDSQWTVLFTMTRTIFAKLQEF